MNLNKQKIIALILFLFWAVGVTYLFLSNNYRQAFIGLVPTAAGLLVFIRGATSVTSIVSRVFIFGGILSLISLLVLGNFSLGSVITYFIAALIATGLILERISPHTKLKKWMFLGIATKIEAIIIGSIIAVASDASFGINWWLVVLPLMIFSVLLLALKQKKLYKATVILTTAVSLGLFIAISLPLGFSSVTTILSVLAVVWPAVVQRLIGYRVFVLSKQ